MLYILFIYGKIEPQTEISFKSIELHGKNKKITFGKNSNIIYPGLVDTVCKVIDSLGHFVVKFDQPIYTHVNGQNINKYPLSTTSNDSIKLYDQKFSIDYVINGIPNKDFKYHYVRDIVPGFSDSLNIKSLIAIEEEGNLSKTNIYSLIILDPIVRITDVNQGYRGWQKSKIVKGESIKFHFFKISSSKEFSDGKVNSYIRVTPHRTNFRATHTIIRRNRDIWKILFSNDYRLVLPNRVIREMCLNKDDAWANIDCDINSVSKNDIYVDPFSNFFNSKIAYFDYDDRGNIPMTNVYSGGESKSSLFTRWFRKSFQAESFINPNVKLNFFSDNLTKAFFMLPVFVILSILVFLLYLIYMRSHANQFLYNSEYHVDASDKRVLWGHYHGILLCSLTILLLLKVLIAYKLSFTFPFYNFAYYTSFWILAITPILVYLGWRAYYKINNQVVRKQEIQLWGTVKKKIGDYTRELIAISFLLIIPVLVFIYLWQYEICHEANRYIDGSSIKEWIHSLFLHLSGSGTSNFWNDKNVEVVLFVTLLGGWFAIFPYLFKALAWIIAKINFGFINKVRKLAKAHSKYIFFLALFIPPTIVLIFKTNFHSAIFTPLIIIWTVFVINYIFSAQRKLVWSVVFTLSLPLYFVLIVLLTMDMGYIITFLGITLFSLIILYFKWNWPEQRINLYQLYKARIKLFVLLISLSSIFVLIPALLTKAFNSPSDLNKLSTLDRRMSLFVDFKKYNEIGIRKTEGDCEFFANMAHYAKNAKLSYPTEYGLLDPGVNINSNISLPGYPIAVNDLNPLVGLIGTIGLPPIIILFLIWAILLFLPLRVLIKPPEQIGFHVIHKSGMIRLVAACVFVGSSFYMLMALLGKLPFTGRLIYGLGVDSVAEPLETLVLFILMGLKLHNKTD